MTEDSKADLDNELKKVLEEASLEDAKALFRDSFYVLPCLYLSFWVLDLIYSPENKWLFLGLRFATAVIALGLYRISKSSTKLRTHYILSLIYSCTAANVITFMVAVTDGASSIYYAGLNLVGLATIWFIPADFRFLSIAIFGVYGPYLAMPLFRQTESMQAYTLNAAFICGTVAMGLFIRITHHRLRQGEVLAKLELRREIRGREKVIKTKTEESIKLQKLSSQFSPQVVEAIRVGDIRLDGNVKRAQICALFIDIVGSTDRVVRLDRDEFDAVLKRFMEVSFGVLLKYDLTIDKFLGDGILAFSNEPVKRSDFISRTCYAAYEIKKRLEGEAEFFERRWRKPFQIRAGISTGYANVGFHGSEKYYKTYTAIGPPLALASRLCSTAEPNQIVVDNDVHEAVLRDNFVLKFIGKKTLKGFEDEIIFAYELNDAPAQEFVNDGAMNCTSCGNNVLTLEESGGIYYMKCRSCGFILDSNSELKASA